MTTEKRDSSGAEARLGSWKEIANYLQRDVRTVIRWEKSEGLPVHRHRHLSRSSVYAYPSELEAWRANRRPAAESTRSRLWRPFPAFASTVTIALALMMAGSATRVGALAGAADSIVTRQVWTGADGVFDNAPSPDGKYMAYADWESGNLVVRDLQAETSRMLTKEGDMGQEPQYSYASKWSPDGKRLVYNWYRQSGEELRIVSLDDPRPRMLFREDGLSWAGPLDWSPNGQQILAGISRTGQPAQLVLIPAEGSAPRVVKTFETRSVSSGVALFSPDGRYIVYDRPPGKVAALDVYILDVGTGSESPLVQHPADDCVLGWSPDGNWVLFLSDRAGTLDFWAIRVADGKPQETPVRVKRSVGRVAPLGFTKDGSFYYADVKVARDVFAARIDFQMGKILAPAVKAIVRYEGSNTNPRYSPDGKSLAYVSKRGSLVFPTNSANALCVHSLESGTERVFIDEFARIGVRALAGPRWSPDSRAIVLAGLRVAGAGAGLYQVSLDTSEVRPVAEMLPGVSILNHEFSPQGRRLFYIRQDISRKLWQLLERDLRSGRERELYRTSEYGQLAGVAASPDGKWLAMSSLMGRVLSVMPSNGGAPRAIHQFDKGRYTNPEWTRDGRHLIVGGRLPGEAMSALYRVPVGGGEPRQIVLPERAWDDRPSLHPDGQQIAFTKTINNDSDADVWVMQNFLPGPETSREAAR